mmetsp:Transcript_123014/g.353416  ORF Transcript_123014/g.353416 Transcript_123014/m.353416 type:complete len:270 (+) Transcript_123014:1517-2326(+)
MGVRALDDQVDAQLAVQDVGVRDDGLHIVVLDLVAGLGLELLGAAVCLVLDGARRCHADEVLGVLPELLELRAAVDIVLASRRILQARIRIQLRGAILFLTHVGPRHEWVLHGVNLLNVPNDEGVARGGLEHHNGVRRLQVAGDDLQGEEVALLRRVHRDRPGRVEVREGAARPNKLALGPLIAEEGCEPAGVLGGAAHEALAGLGKIACPVLEGIALDVLHRLAEAVLRLHDEAAGDIGLRLHVLAEMHPVLRHLGLLRPLLVLIPAS